MRPTAARWLAGVVVAAAALTGCSSKHHAGVASVATTFTQESGSPTAPPVSPAPSSPALPSPSGSVRPQSSDAAAMPSPTPCPVAAPQIFVEGKASAHSADGGVTFSYLDAQRMCGGPDDVQFVTTGSKLTTATVTPSAVVKLLPSAGSTQALQVPVAALPAAMAADKGAPYYAITLDNTGAITSIEQYFHP